MARQEGDDDNEEAWDLADEEAQEGVSSSQELHREWSSRHTHFHTLGYRDGIEEGKKSSVQQGFDVGYSQSVEAGLNCGLARGWTGAFTALPPSVQSLLLDDTARMQVAEVQAVLSSMSSDKATLLYYDKLKGADVRATTAESESISQEGMKASELKGDTLVSLEKLHSDLHFILQSNGIIHR